MPENLSEALSKLCGLFCHQLPWRSPQFEGTVFPLCFRCTGLYLGLVSSYLYLAASGGLRRSLPALRCAITTSFLTAPFLVDGWANLLHLWSSPDWVRAVTGVGVGVVLPLLLVPLAQQTVRGGTSAPKPTLPQPAALLWPVAISSALLWLVVHPTHLMMFHLLAIAASIGPVCFLISFGLALWRTDTFFAGLNSPLRRGGIVRI